MRRASMILKDAEEIGTVEDLTGVFESIASTMVAKKRSRVELSKEFFHLLWTLYTSIRIDPKTRITERTTSKKLNKNAFVIISAEAGLSGDIDERLIETMLQDFDSKTTDIIVLGNHGATQLRQNRIPFVRYFSVPSSESYIDVSPVIEAISHYNHTTVYYEEYISLGVQGIKKLDLISSIRAMTKDLIPGVEVMTTQDTIF